MPSKESGGKDGSSEGLGNGWEKIYTECHYSACPTPDADTMEFRIVGLNRVEGQKKQGTNLVPRNPSNLSPRVQREHLNPSLDTKHPEIFQR